MKYLFLFIMVIQVSIMLESCSSSSNSTSIRIYNNGNMAEDSTFNFSLSNTSESDLKITTPPIMIKSVDPIVPNIARRAGISGIVGVKAWVYTDSLVKRAKIVHSEADLFNEAALRAVMQYKFIPARSGDKFTSGWVDVFVRFNK